MANYEATRYDFDAASLTGIQGVNTGNIVPWSTESIPSGFLECDGTAVSRSTYSALFAVVGTTYGIGDGSTTFNIPDLNDKCCIGASPTKALASSGGANTVASTGSISGTADSTTLSSNQISSHSHPGTAGNGPDTGPPGGGNAPNSPGVGFVNQASGSAGGDGSHTHSVSGTFTGNEESVLQPYLTMVYIIKT